MTLLISSNAPLPLYPDTTVTNVFSLWAQVYQISLIQCHFTPYAQFQGFFLLKNC